MVAGVGVVAFASPGGSAAPVTAVQAAAAAKQDQPAAALQVLSVTPTDGQKSVNGADPIKVQFSAPLAANSPMPTLSPAIAGQWSVEGDTAVFTPQVGYMENSHVTVKIPGGSDGVVSMDGASAGSGGLLADSTTDSFTTGSFSTLRLQQLLSELGYLPLTWTPGSDPISATDANAQLSAAYKAPDGLVQLDRRLPVQPDQPVGGRLGQHPERRRGAGLRVGERADHGRQRRAGRVVPAAQRGGRAARTTRTATPTRWPTSTRRSR